MGGVVTDKIVVIRRGARMLIADGGRLAPRVSTPPLRCPNERPGRILTGIRGRSDLDRRSGARHTRGEEKYAVIDLAEKIRRRPFGWSRLDACQCADSRLDGGGDIGRCVQIRPGAHAACRSISW